MQMFLAKIVHLLCITAFEWRTGIDIKILLDETYIPSLGSESKVYMLEKYP